MTMPRARSCSTASEPRQSKEELWEGALERPVGDGAVVQMIGLESRKHIVYARVVRLTDGGDAEVTVDENGGAKSGSPQVTVMSAIQTMVDEGTCHVMPHVDTLRVVQTPAILLFPA